MKKILILGASDYQIPLIQASKKENYITIVCDYNSKAKGVALADVFYEVSTTDVDKILEISKNEMIDGIIGNSEAVMSVVAKVSTALQIPGNLPESIELLTSKKKFRDLQRKCGCFCPKFLEISSYEDFVKNSTFFKFPIIIKPSQSSGSRGTTKIDSINETSKIKAVIEECIKYSRNGLVVLEEYIPMISNQVIEGEIFVNNGQILCDGLFTTIRSEDASMIPMTYCFPAFLDDYQKKQIITEIKLLLTQAGIQHGEYNVELYYTTGNKLFTVEINARQGGNMLPEYVNKHCGIDMYRLLVSTCVGNMKYWDEIISIRNKPCNYMIHHMLFSKKSGYFDKINVSKKYEKFISSVDIFKNKGDTVERLKDSTSKIGYIDFVFDNIEKEYSFAKIIEEKVNVVVLSKEEGSELNDRN